MTRKTQVISMEKGFAPRWSWRAVWLALVLTIMLYMGLPYLERLSAPVRPVLEIRPVSTIAPPVPLQPPPEPIPSEVVERPRAPELPRMTQALALPPANLSLRMGIGDVGGDFDWGFALATLDGELDDMVFELGALDEPPRAIVQLRPQYPPQARLRQQEGYVTVAFIVNAEGAVEAPVVVEGQPADLFDQAALRAVARWRFSPGMREGAAVAVRVRQRVEFRLQ
ncbi:MAG: energy transducer TonB [Kiritimatiellia bacterium]